MDSIVEFYIAADGSPARIMYETGEWYSLLIVIDSCIEFQKDYRTHKGALIALSRKTGGKANFIKAIVRR